MTEDDVNTFRCISAIDKSNGENHYRSLLQQPTFARTNCINQIQICRSKQSKLSALKKTDIGRTLVDKSNHVRQHALNFRQNVYSVK